MGWIISFVSLLTSGLEITLLAECPLDRGKIMPVKAIIADTETGRIARLVSSHRPPVPIYVKSPDIHTVRELSLTYGVYAQQQARSANTEQLISQSVRSLLSEGVLEEEDVVVIVGGTPGLSGTTNFLVINNVAHCLQEELPD
jgi:pyruvate kinase